MKLNFMKTSMNKIKMVAFDMAGTTVRDNQEVEKCFIEAARTTGLDFHSADILSMMGWSKRLVFETLWRKFQPKADDSLIQQNTNNSYLNFKKILEIHYLTHPIVPTEGTLELFSYLKAQNIKIALTTGFYRQVTDIILKKLGWLVGLDANYVGYESSVINVSVSSDQVQNSRPAPDMIFKAMQLLEIRDSNSVINIGDTPSDLQSGINAGCFLSLGVTNGTHSFSQLKEFENDGLLDNILELQNVIEGIQG